MHIYEWVVKSDSGFLSDSGDESVVPIFLIPLLEMHVLEFDRHVLRLLHTCTGANLQTPGFYAVLPLAFMQDAVFSAPL